MRPLLLAPLLLALLLAPGCRRATRPDASGLPALSAAQVERLVPERERDRAGWAQDVLAAFADAKLHPDVDQVCQVLAVIEQESGFEADPAVPGLARLVEARLQAYAGKLGPLGRPVFDKLLGGKAPGHTRTFRERLGAVRTERDLDVLFRELLAHWDREAPLLFKAVDIARDLTGARNLAELNPVTTAGSMQVSVRFAREEAERRGEDPDAVRDALYTRAGGVRYGTLALLDYEAAYGAPLYRFADYNAGRYASRNAALQAQLNRLTGAGLKTDGDLLLYDAQGAPRDQESQSVRALRAFALLHAPKLSEGRVRKDARKEKEHDFEETATWAAVKKAYAERFLKPGEEAPYAQLPDVALESPKLRGPRSTAWFARSVDERYRKCRGRGAAAGLGPADDEQAARKGSPAGAR